MSIGYGAFARLELEDANTVLYQYGSYNLNDEKYRNPGNLWDGSIIIAKSCFQEPEIHEKIKKMPSGRKKRVTKRIYVDVDYLTMINEGSITIENCSNCWKTVDEKQIDTMALHLLYQLFREYQNESIIPNRITYNV